MLPMSVENFTARNWKREIVIIILDSSFNKIGEVSFDKNANLNPDMMYITPDGVNIHKTGKKEDFLCFYTFTIKNI